MKEVVEKTYTEDELIRFGKYLMSDERKQRFMNHPEFGNDQLEERIKEVQHADLMNFEYFNFKFREGDPVNIIFDDNSRILNAKIISCQKSGNKNIYGISVPYGSWDDRGFTRIHNIEEYFIQHYYSKPK